MQPRTSGTGYRLVFGVGRILVFIVEECPTLMLVFGQVKMNEAIRVSRN
jgi:hypothetical protein